jgi:hypothetical protein
VPLVSPPRRRHPPPSSPQRPSHGSRHVALRRGLLPLHQRRRLGAEMAPAQPVVPSLPCHTPAGRRATTSTPMMSARPRKDNRYSCTRCQPPPIHPPPRHAGQCRPPSGTSACVHGWCLARHTTQRVDRVMQVGDRHRGLTPPHTQSVPTQSSARLQRPVQRQARGAPTSRAGTLSVSACRACSRLRNSSSGRASVSAAVLCGMGCWSCLPCSLHLSAGRRGWTALRPDVVTTATTPT